MFVSILVLWTAISMLTVWTLWEVMSVTVLQDTLEMELTALVNSYFIAYTEALSYRIFPTCFPLYNYKDIYVSKCQPWLHCPCTIHDNT